MVLVKKYVSVDVWAVVCALTVVVPVAWDTVGEWRRVRCWEGGGEWSCCYCPCGLSVGCVV